MKKNILLAACICLSVFFSGCRAEILESNVILPMVRPPSTSTENMELVTRGANEFAFNISAILSNEIDDNNFVFSPYSLWLPLVALVNATDSEGQYQLIEALGAHGLEVDDVNRAASSMIYDLTEKEDSPLKIANAIFASHLFNLDSNFAQTFTDYFRASSMTLDFDEPESVDVVNQWASDNTNGLIDKVVDRFSPDLVAIIANAIYFAGNWELEFEVENTKEGVFNTPSGEVTVDLMRQRFNAQPYFEDDYVQAINLRFDTGGGMYIILPKDGNANDLMRNFTNEYFELIQENSQYMEGTLILPRFKIEHDVEGIIDALHYMGVVDIFDRRKGVPNLIEEDIKVSVSNITQKAVIEVNEKGAEAAAVTLIFATRESVSPTFFMNCDKPFMFILYEDSTYTNKQVLFTGVVNDPS